MKLIEICNPSSLHAQNTNPVSGTAGQGTKFYILYYFKLYLSFIDPERGGFGVIFPEVFAPRKISSLREILRRIPRAEGL